jgi:hypothetical protein
MPDFKQMARRLAPILTAVTEEPYWASVRRLPSGPSDPPDQAVVEFWFGPGFNEWYPEDHCMAIFVVTAGRACGNRLPPALRRTQRDRETRCVVYGVSAEGEPYAAMAPSPGCPLLELEVRNGRRLDAVRSKFGLPPGPPSRYDLEMSSGPDGPPLTYEAIATDGLV